MTIKVTLWKKDQTNKKGEQYDPNRTTKGKYMTNLLHDGSVGAIVFKQAIDFPDKIKRYDIAVKTVSKDDFSIDIQLLMKKARKFDSFVIRDWNHIVAMIAIETINKFDLNDEKALRKQHDFLLKILRSMKYEECYFELMVDVKTIEWDGVEKPVLGLYDPRMFVPPELEQIAAEVKPMWI